MLTEEILLMSQSKNVYIESTGKNTFIAIYRDLIFHFMIDLDRLIIVNMENHVFPSGQITQLVNSHTYNSPMDLFKNLCNTLIDLKSYCIGCCDKLQLKSNVYATCGNIICSYKLEELMIDNDVTDFIKGNFEIFKFLVETTIQTVNSPNVLDMLDPFPNYFLESKYKSELINKKRGSLIKLQLSKDEFDNYNKAKDITQIRTILSSIKFNTINIYPSDHLMLDALGKPTYLLLRFIIKSCCLDIGKEQESDNIKILKINHPFYVENQFRDSNPNPNSNSYLYHGSINSAWYSILRNGIKILSNTTLQQNGAVYGSGIYLSDNYKFALGYSTRRQCVSNENCIVGVYEVQGDKTQYYKTTNIYVVPTHTQCLLKYLILSKTSNITTLSTKLSSEITWIENYFQSKLKEITSIGITKMKIINNKKIANELKKIDKSQYQIELVNSNILNWKVTRSNVNLCLKFPETFPFDPPFAYIESPKFNHESQNITSDGAICFEYLTKSNWLPAISIENLIVQIFSLIIEPNLPNIVVTDNKLLNTEKKASESYEIIAKGNGWL